jgi:hypothetical protein
VLRHRDKTENTLDLQQTKTGAVCGKVDTESTSRFRASVAIDGWGTHGAMDSWGTHVDVNNSDFYFVLSKLQLPLGG